MSGGRQVTWSARQYLAFESERTRPVRDLLSALPAIEARSVIDLGCGPGNSTQLLAARFPEAVVYGLDSSPDMIEAARQRLPRVNFAICDINAWSHSAPLGRAPFNSAPADGAQPDAAQPDGAQPDAAQPDAAPADAARFDAARFDVILANAVLQWIPNHAALLPALVGRLAGRGALAVQMPDNLDSPAHRLMRETAAAGPWAPKLTEAIQARAAIPDAEWYYELLRPLCASVDIWRTTYHHSLPGGAPAVVEWFKGSGLRPFLEPLQKADRAAYLERYIQAIAQAFRAFPDGSVLLPFPRLFVVAVRR
jgi:trans-aconitate 2-methyltransferase